MWEKISKTWVFLTQKCREWITKNTVYCLQSLKTQRHSHLSISRVHTKWHSLSLGEAVCVALCFGSLSPPLQLIQHPSKKLPRTFWIWRHPIFIERFWDIRKGANARNRETSQFRSEWAKSHRSATSSPLTDGVRDDSGWFERVLTASKVIHEVGEGGRESVVVLRRDDHEAVGAFDLFGDLFQVLWGFSCFVVKVRFV